MTDVREAGAGTPEEPGAVPVPGRGGEFDHGGRRRRSYYTLAALRARGWTPGMVRELLGEPDAHGHSPYYGPAAPMKLYATARVETAEGGEDFGRALAASALRSATTRAAAERRRTQVMRRIRAEPIEVPRLSADELAEQAVRHRVSKDEERARDQGHHLACPATVAGTAPAALKRWQVDYLRSRLTGYDALLDGLYGSAGRAEAVQLLRQRVYDAIARAYPGLAAECRRQLVQRCAVSDARSVRADPASGPARAPLCGG